MKIVYRSTHPDVLEHWRRTGSAEAQQAWRERVNEVIADLGFPGHRFATKGETEVVGVEYPQDKPYPKGWRRNSKLPSAISPDRRTTAGKGIGQRLDKVSRPNPRSGLPGGMPEVALAKHTFMHCGVRRIGDAIYVTWSSEIDSGDARHIDPAVWERVKTSEYYAALEAEEAKS